MATGTAFKLTVNLYGIAPSTGAKILLSSSAPESITVPSSIVVPSNATGAVLSLSAKGTVTGPVTLTATYGSLKKTVAIEVTG